MECRGNYKKVQSKLLDMLQVYTSWRTGSWTVRFFGGDEFPSQNLVAQIGSDRSRKGQDALDQMYTIVTVKDSIEAYKSGVLVPEQPFGPTTGPVVPSTVPSTVPSVKPTK
jgi:hypothetical protein